MTERWLPIADVTGYEVSNFGRVRSLPGGKRHVCVLKLHSIPGTGYLQVQPTVRGRNKKIYVHRLVLEAFVGPCPEGMECRHLNGNPKDNRLVNLCWGTRKENQADRRLHGTAGTGEQHSQAKLTEMAVREIRCTKGRGSGNALARKFGVAPSVISRIRKGLLWRKA